jgi:4a-hydroxytetrahydrobiopterin dehydratase
LLLRRRSEPGSPAKLQRLPAELYTKESQHIPASAPNKGGSLYTPHGDADTEKQMTILDSGTRARFLDDFPGWTLDGEVIRTTYSFADFNEAVGFVVRVALIAEIADHHPDIDVRWNKVSIALTTHDRGGLTDRDIDLAARIEEISNSR